MHGRYVTGILKMYIKKFNAENIIFHKITGVLICTLRGYTVRLACSQFLVEFSLDG